VDELSPNPSCDQPSQHHKNSLATEEKATFHQCNSKIYSLRQAKVSQHLALLRQLGIVQAERVGNEMHYALADARILEACHITREILLQQLTQQGALTTMLTGTRES
jgi:DNA-binding transcriptional ArsR family regulator